ncbi:MAG: PH domain-containing protein, partial [Actinomycetota bacterium]|nr:PH domain-containing protein [Actinomycetota bacterium]
MPFDPPPDPSPGPAQEPRAAGPTDRDTAGSPPQANPIARPRRLHPASVLLGLNLRQLAQLFVFPVAASPAGAQAALIVLAVAGTIGLALRVLAWQRFHYSFDGEVLRIDAGVISRHHRALHVDRIQQVEVDRSFLQRLLGLAALRVETAGTSREVEVELRVVSDEEARALRAVVRTGKARANRPATAVATDLDENERLEPRRREVLRVPLRHVVVASVTGVRLLVFPAVIGGALEFAGENLEEWFETVIEQLVVRGVVDRHELITAPLPLGLAVAAVVGLWLLTAIVVGVLRDANFSIEQVEEDLHVSRGLLSTRDSVLPLRRVQLVQVHRNWLRRVLGYTAVRVYSAGGSAEADRRVAIPLLPMAKVDALIWALYPGVGG